MSKTNYEKLEKSLARLKEQYEFFKLNEQTLSGNIKEAVQESIIKRFDICYDTLLKHLRKFMEEQLGMPEVKDFAPKIFRKAKNAGIINEDMQKQLNHYREIRNSSAHDYSEEEAQKTIEIIEDFMADVSEIYQNMTEEE